MSNRTGRLPNCLLEDAEAGRLVRDGLMQLPAARKPLLWMVTCASPSHRDCQHHQAQERIAAPARNQRHLAQASMAPDRLQKTARVGGLYDSGHPHGHAAFNMKKRAAMPSSDASFAPALLSCPASISHRPLLFSTDTTGRDPSSSPLRSLSNLLPVLRPLTKLASLRHSLLLFAL